MKQRRAKMKRNIVLLIMVICCLSLFGCKKEKDDKNNTTENTTEEVILTTNWTTDYLTDDFGDTTNEKCIYCICEGTFSNTATTDSPLIVYAYFDPINLGNDDYSGSLSFRLLEYTNTKATYLSSDNIILKIKIGEQSYSEELIGSSPNGDVYLYHDMGGSDFTSELYSPIQKALDNNEDVRCIIEIGSSSYNFTLSGEGFADARTEYNK